VNTRPLDPTTAEIVFLQQLPASSDRPGRQLTQVGGMIVRYLEQDGAPERIRSVEVWSEEGGLTSSELQRLAWSRWLATADSTVRRPRISYMAPTERGQGQSDPDRWYLPPGSPERTDEGRNVYSLLFGDSFQPSPVPAPEESRPGRRGHPRDHYVRIAKRYLQLRSEGRKDPTAQIAREMGYSRSTVAGWVRRARALGLLPTARRGKPG